MLVWDGVGAAVEAVRAALDGGWEAIRVRGPPGTTTSPAEAAELVAFLASPAGAYYSGCRFDLGRVSSLSA